MKQIIFKIDEKNFRCDMALLSAQSFVVQSVPRSYSVSLTNDPNSFAQINQLLAKNSKNLLLIDGNVLRLYQSELDIAQHAIFAVEATESFKTLEGVTKAIGMLLGANW